MIRIPLSLSLLFLSCASLQADIIAGDWKVAGDAKLTIDTVQGLEFLDLTESANRSFNDVSSQLGVGGDFEGFRYATVQEVVALINQIGWSPIATEAFTSQPWNANSESTEILGFLGVNRSDASLNASTGITSTPRGTGRRVVDIFDSLNGTSPTDFVDASTTKSVSESSAHPFNGSFLTRSNAVPEPTSFLLLSSLLVPLAMLRRRPISSRM